MSAVRGTLAGLQGIGRVNRRMVESVRGPRAWHLIDAKDQVVGKVANVAAILLTGKHKPTADPRKDVGDFVVIVNAEAARFTGKKETTKKYFKHTGYPGGDSMTPAFKLRAKHPTAILEKAIRGKIPKNNQDRYRMMRLKLFVGPEHSFEEYFKNGTSYERTPDDKEFEIDFPEENHI